MFEHITAAKMDPILGLDTLYAKDIRSNTINLCVGVYKNEQGETPILRCVKKTEAYLLEQERDKKYLPISGLESYIIETQKLILGSQHPTLSDNRVRSVQTLGGTGALKVAADFLLQNTAIKTIWISAPTWPNHQTIFENSGLTIKSYPYLSNSEHALDFEKMVAVLETIPAGDAVLFHACCHNPTGLDFTFEQWQYLEKLSLEKKWLPVFDFAYQGFANGLNEDSESIRLFARSHKELLICHSYSKNFSMYNERVGSLTLIAENSEIANNALSRLKVTIRSNYSNPPAHGAKVIATILQESVLRQIWELELNEMRERILRMRKLLVITLQEKKALRNYQFIAEQKGMFSFSGLKLEQVLQLREEFGIYMVDSGRMNVAAITLQNISFLCESILAVEVE